MAVFFAATRVSALGPGRLCQQPCLGSALLRFAVVRECRKGLCRLALMFMLLHVLLMCCHYDSGLPIDLVSTVWRSRHWRCSPASNSDTPKTDRETLLGLMDVTRGVRSVLAEGAGWHRAHKEDEQIWLTHELFRHRSIAPLPARHITRLCAFECIIRLDRSVQHATVTGLKSLLCS